MSVGERGAAFDDWARRGAGPKMEEAHEHAGKKVLDRIEIGYDESFIDLGCGNGWAARHVAAKIPTIGLCVGVDVSEELIKEARRASAGKYPVKFLVAPMEGVPFGEASFHHAFSMEALYYAQDPLLALKATWRLLKPGGTLHFVTDFYKENAPSRAWQADIRVPMHWLSAAEWVGLFKAVGFADVASERIFDERPVPAGMVFPWGGFVSREDLEVFRTATGSLYVRGRKVGDSHALDPFLDRAAAQVAGEPELAGRAPTAEKGKGGRPRFGRRKGGKR